MVRGVGEGKMWSGVVRSCENRGKSLDLIAALFKLSLDLHLDYVVSSHFLPSRCSNLLSFWNSQFVRCVTPGRRDKERRSYSRTFFVTSHVYTLRSCHSCPIKSYKLNPNHCFPNSIACEGIHAIVLLAVILPRLVSITQGEDAHQA